MRIHYIKGNLINLAKEGNFGAIAHGANCFHTMGSGIAPQMNNLTNGMLLEADKQTPIADVNKLGEFSNVTIELAGKNVEVYNLYTQFGYGTKLHGQDSVVVHWQSVYNAIEGMLENTLYPEFIGIPYIGCGLAGGSVSDFIEVLDNVKNNPYNKNRDTDLYVVEFDPTA